MFFCQLLYLCASVCFILALRGLSSAKTAQKGNWLGITGMVIALMTTLLSSHHHRIGIVFLAILIGGLIGLLIARKIQMTALPQLVAAFHSLIGCAAVLIAASTLYAPQVFKIGINEAIHHSALFEIGLGAIIGAITFTGSVVAFLKLQGIIKGYRLVPVHPHLVNFIAGVLCLIFFAFFIITKSHILFWEMIFIALFLGAGLIFPIGGSDMPVIVSMLNSYSGWAAAATGFTLNNHLLIITGALVGSAGAILSYVMCKNMNRSIGNVMLGGFGHHNSSTESSEKNKKPVKIGSADDAVFILNNAASVIIVPGYGMAVAQAQRVLCEMARILQSRGIKVRYAIHPVAGRMPGHMNVLLAEANVPYDDIFELDAINHDFSSTDVAFVIGANDITNPAAHKNPQSPIYGMPILNVEEARTVLFVKRSLGSGYAGIDNELFYNNNTMMILGDAKKVCEDLIKYLKL